MATRQNTFRQTPEFQFGRSVELMIANHLRKNGWLVLPSYDYCGEDDKAPRLQGYEISYVIPDLDCCKNGRRCWVEVKAKAGADWTRVTRRLEHGINLRLYNHYVKVREHSGCEVYICIYEQRTKLAFIQSLAILELPHNSRIYSGSKMGKGGMFFFARDAMKWLAHLELT